MTSSIGSTRADTRVESRSQTQDVSNARATTQDPGADPSAPKAATDASPSPTPVETTPKVSHETALQTRDIQRNDAANRLTQARLQSLEVGQSATLVPSAATGSAAKIGPENVAPNLEQVAAGTHVLMEGHRDLTPDGGIETSQQMLNRVGADPALDEDGIYGPKTAGAVEAFQRDNGLTVDGKLGDETLAALEARDEEEMRDRISQSSLPPGTQQDVLSRFDSATPAEQRGIFGLADSKNFGALDETRQGELLEAAAVDPGNSAYTGALDRLAGSKDFQNLDPATRERTLSQLAKHTDDPDAAQTLTDLASTPGFGALSADEQGRMLDYVGANTDLIAPDARAGLDGVLADPAFTGASPADQAQQLRTYMQDQPGIPGVLTYPPGHMDAQRRDFTVSDPTEVQGHQFRGSAEDALRYDVTVGDHTIPVYLPANLDPTQGDFHSIDEIARGLAAMPDVALGRVNDVTINPGQNPDDAYWANEYGDPNFRSYMTAGAGGNITVYPSVGKVDQSGLDASLLHEVGHTVSHNAWGHDETQPAWQGYRDAIAADGLDISTYGQNNPDEDFSEAFKLYMGVRGTDQEAEVRAMYPNRFSILDQIVQGQD